MHSDSYYPYQIIDTSVWTDITGTDKQARVTGAGTIYRRVEIRDKPSPLDLFIRADADGFGHDAGTIVRYQIGSLTYAAVKARGLWWTTQAVGKPTYDTEQFAAMLRMRDCEDISIIYPV